jgi:arylsulfatase
VFLLPDQMRSDFLSCYGADFIDTPNIDSLAENGTRYENSYSASPICVPARTALLTGMNAMRNGVTDNLHAIRGDYNDVGIRTWPQILADDGYYTAAIGKMHFYPWDARHGFQYRVIAEDKRWLEIRDDYYHYLRQKGLRKYHGNEHEGYEENRGAITNLLKWEDTVDRFVGREAVKFIENYGDEGPFAMMVGFPGPHCPYDPPGDIPYSFEPEDMPLSIPEVEGDAPALRQTCIDSNKRAWNGVDYTEFTEEQKKKIRGHYAALVKGVDFEVGEILRALREKGLLENTVVVLSSDHADYLGDHNLIGKSSFYETCMRVPMIAQGPGIPAGQVNTGLVELRDVTTTILAAAGVEIPSHMDSRPLPGIGLTDEPARERIFGMLSDGWMNYDGRWKLARYASGDTTLFDLDNDPTEQVNLATDSAHSETMRRLDLELSQEIMESMQHAFHDRLAQSGDMSQDHGFGREGWRRPWPTQIGSLQE